jgi:hypothetical protein
MIMRSVLYRILLDIFALFICLCRVFQTLFSLLHWTIYWTHIRECLVFMSIGLTQLNVSKIAVTLWKQFLATKRRKIFLLVSILASWVKLIVESLDIFNKTFCQIKCFAVSYIHMLPNIWLSWIKMISICNYWYL